MDNIFLALQLTALGLGGVFISLILLYLMINILANVFKDKTE
ncbi:MAG: OadG family protein [Clostridia bacterium]|jgi:Na+-transporting methylmalonyl-CoA/oxaloacetate decarboxylase gamma subunit|nr:OadG family protein [Clostridia bacterium]